MPTFSISALAIKAFPIMTNGEVCCLSAFIEKSLINLSYTVTSEKSDFVLSANEHKTG